MYSNYILGSLISKPTERAWVLLRNGTRDFQNRDWHVFIWRSLKIFNVFNTLTLKPIFSKTKTFFKKLEYRFLVESTRIENVTFPYKTVLPEANVKTNRMGLQNGPIVKNGVLPVTTLVFRKKNLSLRISYKELIWCTNHPNVHIHTFRKGLSFIWGSLFPVSILNINWHICTSFDFAISRAKSSEKLNKIVSKLFYHLDNVTLHSVNLILSRE